MIVQMNADYHEGESDVDKAKWGNADGGQVTTTRMAT